MRPHVVIFGGSGFFGRLVVADLLQHGDVEIRVVSRQPSSLDFGTGGDRVSFARGDVRDPEAVRRQIRDADVAISCVGPYQGQPLTLLQACLAERVHYLDVSDDRDFVERAFALRREIQAAGIVAFPGCSVVPGLSSLLTAYAQQEIGPPAQVRLFIAPGTSEARGPGSFAALLATVGERYRVPWNGGWRQVRGWSQRERIAFPPSIGDRWTYVALDGADSFTQPLYFDTQRVLLKVGCEIDLLNRAVGCIGTARRLFPRLPLNLLIPLFRKGVSLVSPLGTSRGAFLAEVTARDGRALSLCVYAASHGEVIPSLLPSIATLAILRGDLRTPGIVQLPSWIAAADLRRELAARGVSLGARRGDDHWIPYPEEQS
jgi:hypothetical protein